MNRTDKKPSFSIILAVQEQAEALQNQLPSLLTQQYDDFQVIVVDESSTDNTSDVLGCLKEEFLRLYNTFVPRYHFQRNPRRLAFTIGMKAAKNDWIIFTDLETLPTSETWLEELSEFAVSPNEMLLGYVKRKTGDVRLKSFEDISQAGNLVTKTERRRANGSHHSSLFSCHKYFPSLFFTSAVRGRWLHTWRRMHPARPC